MTATTSSLTTPLVSIGMTVYNAHPFVAETLESLLAQDYPQLEICISDNASSDGSSEICQRYAAGDARIRYARNEENLGAVRNWNRALELSSGQYFMWASDHDLWDASYISRAVEVLERRPQTVLVYPHVTLIDEHGDTIEVLADQLETTNLKAADRYARILWKLKRCHMIHGVMRGDVLRELNGFPNVWSMDMPLLGALTLYGEFAQLDEYLYYRRENRPIARSSTSEQTKQFHVSNLDPAKSQQRQRMSQRDLRRETRNAQLRLLWKAPVSVFVKLRLTALTLHVYWARYGIGLWGLERLRRLVPRGARRAVQPREAH